MWVQVLNVVSKFTKLDFLRGFGILFKDKFWLTREFPSN